MTAFKLHQTEDGRYRVELAASEQYCYWLCTSRSCWPTTWWLLPVDQYKSSRWSARVFGSRGEAKRAARRAIGIGLVS